VPRSIVVALLSAHVFVFLALTLAYSNSRRYPIEERLSLIPFRSIARDVSAGGDALRVNIIENVVVMLPLGAAIGFLGGRLRRAATAGFLLSATVEALQLWTGRRVTDVDDVVLNTLGAMLGFLAVAAVRRAFRRGGSLLTERGRDGRLHLAVEPIGQVAVEDVGVVLARDDLDVRIAPQLLQRRL